MNQEHLIQAINLNSIIQQKLEGVANKLETAKENTKDAQLQDNLQTVLNLQRKITRLVEKVESEK